MMATPGLTRSPQSRMFLGLPLRTRNTIVDVYGELLCGKRDCQFTGSSLPLVATASMSPASASVTTSAGRPSMTVRACLPEPPCDCLTVTSSPVLPFQYFANAALYSTYNSRVGSYDALSNVTSFACANGAASASSTHAVAIRKCLTMRALLEVRSELQPETREHGFFVG